jgi:hypothetical protein
MIFRHRSLMENGCLLIKMEALIDKQKNPGKALQLKEVDDKRDLFVVSPTSHT